MDGSTYNLITPAKNEEAHIGRTIEAVLSQTVLPSKWLIVSDGSVDRTDDIVEHYARRHSFIRLMRNEPGGAGKAVGFGSKALAFRKGYESLAGTRFSLIGNLDADITFESGRYYETVTERMVDNPRLGIAGGRILELADGKFVGQNVSSNSVAGAVQLFRRQCYEGFGGYIPMMRGGIDAAAEIMARMYGWQVTTFADLQVFHHRWVSTSARSVAQARFRQGITNHLLGYHPVFQVASSLSRIKENPLILGSICMLSGYCWSWIKRQQHVLSPDAV